MTNEGTAIIGWAEAARLERIGIALALGLGLLLGSGLTTLALERLHREPQAAVATAKSWRHPALDREWRGTRTPVDVDRMFRTR